MPVIAVPRSPQPGDDRGDGARRPRLPHGRGGRRVQRRLQGQPGDARPVRPAPGRSTRRSPRKGFAGIGIGAAMVGLRPIIEFMTFSFSLRRHRPDRQQRRQHALHERRPVRRADRLPRQLGDGRLPGGDPLAPARGLVRPDPRPDRDPARHPGRRQGAAQERHPLATTRSSSSSTRTSTATRARSPRASTSSRSARPTIKRPGADVTLITYSRSLKTTLAAAEKLAEEGIDAEVIDLRTIRPLDLETLLASVVKTHRAVIVEEDWPYCGLGAGISDRIYSRRLRRARRADPPRRRQGRADPLQPGARSARCSRRVERIVAAGQRRALPLRSVEGAAPP